MLESQWNNRRESDIDNPRKPADDRLVFGDQLRTLRTERGIGLREFARQVGISPAYLSQIERGMAHPPPEDKVRLFASALGEEPDHLIAISGRLPETLRELLFDHPREITALLRALDGLSAEHIEDLCERARRMKVNALGDSPNGGNGPVPRGGA